MAMTADVAASYSATGGAWQRGPGPIYDRLAEVLVARAQVPLAGCRVLDVGAGTGAATKAVLAAGASTVVAVDAAFGMLAHRAHTRPPSAVGDALALPLAASVFDASVAAFSLNHLGHPAAGLGEMARVTRRGGLLLVASYAAEDDHPVKAVVEAALAARGWVPEPWYLRLHREATPRLAEPELAAAAADAAGLDPLVEVVAVPFPDLGPGDLVAWRLGLAQHAPFVSQLPQRERLALRYEAVVRLGADYPVLVRSMLVLQAIRP